MPLVRFELRNEYALGDSELHRRAAKREEPKALLDGLAVAGLVGILRQLGDLAEFAADVFHDLHEQVTATTARGKKMLTRIHNIEAALPSIEKAVQSQTSHIHFTYVAGCDWHANVSTEENHLSGDLPRFILESYEECRDPPRLYLLDKFDIAGAGACLKRYSDPSYFKRVWAASVLTSAEKVPTEKKGQKHKRKGSWLRNREFPHSISINQQSSSSMRFASPSTDRQSISSDNIVTSDTRLKPELGSASASSDSNARSNHADQVFGINLSVMPDEIESDNSSVSKLQINHSDICDPIPHDGPLEDGADGYSPPNLLQEPNVMRGASVTWIEKAEIAKPSSPNSCDDILVDIIQDSELQEVRCEPLDMDHETADIRAQEEDILFDIENLQVSVSDGNHFDEITSETDNYMDALNTMESETETDSECQTKREVMSLHNCTNQGLESGTPEMPEIAASNLDTPDVEAPIASNVSLSKDDSPQFSHLDHLEGLDFVCKPCSNGFTSIADCSLQTDHSESDFHDMRELNSIKDPNGMPSESSTLKDKSPANKSKLQDLPVGISSVPPAMLWTNGGLLGVEPSKPIDFSIPDTVSETILSGRPSGISVAATMPTESLLKNPILVEKTNGSPNVSRSTDQSSLRSDLMTGKAYNALQTFDPCKFSSIAHNDHREAESIAFTCVYPHADRPDPTKAGATDLAAELPDTSNSELHSNLSSQTSLSISSSLSGLAQRFLANSLQRTSSLTNADSAKPSEMVDNGTRNSQETSLPNRYHDIHNGSQAPYVYHDIHNGSQALYEPRIIKKTENGSFRRSISSSSHYSNQSSPPLEHMRLSFHPMNSADTSKLKLEFSNGNVNAEDLMFPSFQLLPAPTVPLPGSGCESDNDTFCHSCPYSSEDVLSARSDSDSELWEQEERNTSINHSFHDDTDRFSSLSASVSNSTGFDGMNHLRIDASGHGNMDIVNDIMCFQSSSFADLPVLDSIKHSKKKQDMEHDSSSIDPVDSSLQSPNELPPSPSLPPVQWRSMKSTFMSGEEKNSVISENVDHSNASNDQMFAGNQKQGHDVLKPPLITEQGKQKLNGLREPKHGHNESEDRDEFLQQIRNKTFNLRRTEKVKSNFVPQPTTNVNVAAILEKANAIRQAFAGSDDGAEDDNWSDG